MSETGLRHYAMTIDGRSVEPASGEKRTVPNPFDLSDVGTYAVADLDCLEQAIAAARKAFPAWAKEPDSVRADACRALGQVLEENSAELAELITREQGKPLDAGGFGSRFELGGCVGWAMATASLELPEKTLLDGDGVRAVQRRVPKGVVGSITPWNWPLLIAIWHIIPAIRTGNCVVNKPSPFTPLATLRAIELMNTVLPAGVLNVVTGDAEIGSAMSTHPDIDKLIFTGSTATGVRVMQGAATNITDCTLELGGNDAAVVLPGAPVEAMAPGLFFGSFINAGQTCGAIKRIYVSDEDHDRLADSLAKIASGTAVGNGLEAQSAMGPVQNRPQFEKVRSLTADAVQHGAKLLAGGEPVGNGYALKPAILGDCTNDMALVREEQFGPVIPLVRYKTLDDAVKMANSSKFGLCASVWGTDPDTLAQTASRLEAGTVYVNTHAELHPMVPFGGIKSSGIGVQFGEEGLLAFTDSKVIYERQPG